MADPTAPSLNIQTTTNQYLAPAWVDLVLKDNFFFGEVLSNTKKWDGSQMLFPIKFQKERQLRKFSRLCISFQAIQQQVVS